MLPLLWTQHHIFAGLWHGGEFVLYGFKSGTRWYLPQQIVCGVVFCASHAEKTIKSGHGKELLVTPEGDTSLHSAFPCSWALELCKFLLQEISLPYTHWVSFASCHILNSPCKKNGWIIDPVQGEQRGYSMMWCSQHTLQGEARWREPCGSWLRALQVDLRHFSSSQLRFWA